jgi:hypothetical protein
MSSTADIPEAVLKAASTWKNNIPLAFLTDEFVNSQRAKMCSFAHSFLSHPDADMWTSDDTMDYGTWERATHRELQLMARFFPAKAKIWEMYHKEFNFGGKIPAVRWPARVKYNTLLRANTLPSGPHYPIENAKPLWVRAEDHASALVKEDLEAKNRALESRINDLANMFATQKSPAHVPPKPPKSGASNPAANTAQAGQSFRPQAGAQRGQGSATRNADAPKRPQFCFVCGGTSHWHKYCTATSQVNGRDLLTRNNRRTWVFPDLTHQQNDFCLGDARLHYPSLPSTLDSVVPVVTPPSRLELPSV